MEYEKNLRACIANSLRKTRNKELREFAKFILERRECCYWSFYIEEARKRLSKGAYGEAVNTLVSCSHSEIVGRIITDENVSPSRLEELSCHHDPLIRLGVLINNRSPPQALERLSYDEYSLLRLMVTAHKNTPKHVLERLASYDEVGYIRDRAKEYLQQR